MTTTAVIHAVRKPGGPQKDHHMKLYGTPPTRALRAIWLINELGLDCEIITVDMGVAEQASPAFRKLNPAGKLPVLVDGDLILTESCAIPLYLAEKSPDKGLIPADIADRARMYQWLFFLATEIEQPLWRIGLHTRIYDEAERRPEEIPLAARDARAMIAVMEAHMQGREVLVGDRLTVADFNAAYTLDWANMAGLLDEAPRLRAYLKAMYERPTAPMTIAQGFAAIHG